MPKTHNFPLHYITTSSGYVNYSCSNSSSSDRRYSCARDYILSGRNFACSLVARRSLRLIAGPVQWSRIRPISVNSENLDHHVSNAKLCTQIQLITWMGKSLLKQDISCLLISLSCAGHNGRFLLILLLSQAALISFNGLMMSANKTAFICTNQVAEETNWYLATKFHYYRQISMECHKHAVK